MRLFRFIRVRLTLWYGLLLAVLLAAFSLGVYVALREALTETIADSIDSRAALVTALVTADGALRTEGVDIPGDPLEGEHFARVFDANGNLLLDNSTPEFSQPPDQDAIGAALAGKRSWRDMETSRDYLRVLTAPLIVEDEIVGAIEIAQSQQDFRDTLRLLILIIVIAYPPTLIAAMVGGVWLAGRALAPIDQLTRVAREITVQDMGGRIDTSGPDDELGRLARTLDEMITRLDDSFGVSGSLLRTPRTSCGRPLPQYEARSRWRCNATGMQARTGRFWAP